MQHESPYPLTGRKVYQRGPHGMRVPQREVRVQNNDVAVHFYDTSGPCTDPEQRIDAAYGLPPLRSTWIDARGDTEVLAGLTVVPPQRFSHLQHLSTPVLRRAKRAPVTQIAYARRGEITPEMEFVALRENVDAERLPDPRLRPA